MSIGGDVGEELATIEAEGGQTQVGPGQLQLFRLEQGLSTLTKVAMMFVAIGAAALAAAFVEWLANLAQRATSWLSWFGINTASGITHGAQWLTNRLGTQYNKIDSELGSGLTEINTELKLLGADVLAAGFTVWRLTKTVKVLARRPNLGPVVHTVVVQGKATAAKATQTSRKVIHITKIIPAPLPHNLPQHVAQLQAQVKHQQTEIVQLREQVKHQHTPSTLAQAAPIVALGLAGLGLNASRCEGPRTFDKALCEAGPQGLNSLLSLLGFGAVFLGLVPLAEAEQKVIGEASSLVHDFWRV